MSCSPINRTTCALCPVALCAGLLLPLVVAAQAPPEPVPALIRQGHAHAEAGRRADAESAFQKAVARAPAHFDAHFGLAQVRHRWSDLAGAARSLEAANLIRPERQDVVRLLIGIYGKQKSETKEADAIRRLLELRPADRPARRRLAYLYGRAGKFEIALPLLQQLVREKPSDATSHYTIALVYAARVRRRAADAAANAKGEARTEKNPDVEAAAANRQDLVFAVAALRRTLQLDPDMGEARERLGALYLRLSQRPEAARVLAALVADEPGRSSARALLAEARYASGDVAGARAVLEDRLSGHPRDRTARWALARILERDGRVDEAIRQLERLIAKDGQVRGERDIFERDLLQHPVGLRAIVKLADLYADRERFNEALLLYDYSLTFQTRNVGLHLKLARTALRSGNIDLAKKHTALARILGAEAKDLVRQIEAEERKK